MTINGLNIGVQSMILPIDIYLGKISLRSGHVFSGNFISQNFPHKTWVTKGIGEFEGFVILIALVFDFIVQFDVEGFLLFCGIEGAVALVAHTYTVKFFSIDAHFGEYAVISFLFQIGQYFMPIGL